MKRIVTIQDISCVGKCSLTVALPIISAMGVEAAVLPTAVLSTHTAIPGFTFRDLTAEIRPISEHWKQERYTFDAIYTGYLGSFEQLELVTEFMDEFQTVRDEATGKERPTCVFIDPVMGDFGRLYSGFTPEFAREMSRFCARADVIVPNMTEACWLLGMEYLPEGTYTENQVRDILRRLCDLGPKNTVLTGTSFQEDRVGFMGFCAETETFFTYMTERIPHSFHGTGDIFASATVGALMNDFSLCESLSIAADFTLECIRESLKDSTARNYGVNFESAVPYLIHRIGK
ncbi:MAG: pyridoxamine kinase [Planctomycetia bacterium]|nr:pyridoxamine kinase [Planctomycetia bacterium]